MIALNTDLEIWPTPPLIFTALHCMQRGLSYEHLSVCLSVRLSNA